MDSSTEKVLLDSCIFDKCFKIYLFMSLLHIWSRCFSNCCFCVASKDESVHKHFKSGLSILYSLSGLLGITPVGFQRQMFWGLTLWNRSWGLEFLMWGTNLSFMRAEFYTVEISPNYGSLLVSGVYEVVKATPLPLLVVSMWPFILDCRGALQLVYRTFWEGIDPYVTIYLMCLVEGSKFRIFLHWHL